LHKLALSIALPSLKALARPGSEKNRPEEAIALFNTTYPKRFFSASHFCADFNRKKRL